MPPPESKNRVMAMRAVLDTSTVISGLLWRGPSHQILRAAHGGQLTLFTSRVLLAELEDVLLRPKFAQRLAHAAITPRELILGYAALARLVTPAGVAPVIFDDPDDDAVIACAVAAQAEVIVSGDRHLLALRSYEAISIVTSGALMATLGRS